MKIFLSPLGRRMGVLSKENWEGGQGRKEGEWWRGKDDILPIGNGKGSGWEGERSEGTYQQPHLHPLLVKQELVPKSTGDEERRLAKWSVRSCCARPPDALTLSSKFQIAKAWAKGARTCCLGSCCMGLSCSGFNCIVQVLNTGILEVGT